MARREITAARKQALLADLRKACRDGELVPGDRLPPVRELAARYELAQRTITLTLQELLDDGTLQSIPRVGIVVAKPVEPRMQVVYLAVMPDTDAAPVASSVAQLTVPAFESQVARLGGRTARIPANTIAAALSTGGLSDIGGAFFPTQADARVHATLTEHGIPIAMYTSGARAAARAASSATATPDLDVIEFDNVGGGRNAAELLLAHGSDRIGYAGIHSTDDISTESFPWSIERGHGMRQATGDSQWQATKELTPATSARSYRDRLRSVAHRAVTAVHKDELNALVCANDAVALQMIAQLRNRNIPPQDWPALVGFDSVAAAGPYLLTSFRLPWERVGTTAADVLWRRTRPADPASLRIHQVPMDLAHRLSSSPHWAESITNLDLFAAQP